MIQTKSLFATISLTFFVILAQFINPSFAGSSSSTSAQVVAIYGGDSIYSLNNPYIQNNINDLKASGFTTIIFWSVHVGPNGDLSYNDRTIVANGKYVGDPAWSSYIAQLKSGTTSVNRIFFSVGSADVVDFQNIRDLIQAQGIGSNSILYRNFQALKNEIPGIYGIDLDDEDLYDQNTIVQFSLLLGKLDFKVSFCVYDNMAFWISCLQQVNKKSSGLVSNFFLQCYAGGEDQDPLPWKLAIAAIGLKTPVYPGLWTIHDEGDGDEPSDMQTRYKFWRYENVQGGFIWFYDDILANGLSAQSYASAIKKGLKI